MRTVGKLGYYVFHLVLEGAKRSVVPQNDIGQREFRRERELFENALFGEFPDNPSLLQPCDLLGRRGGHANREIKPILQVLFKKQRHLNHPACAGWSAAKRFAPKRKKTRVCERLQPQSSVIAGKHTLRQPCTVKLSEAPLRTCSRAAHACSAVGTICEKNPIAEFFMNCRQHLRLAQNPIAHKCIGVQPRKPVLSKQCRCSRLPTPHPTCNADNHKIPKSADSDFGLDILKTFVFINKKRSTPEQIAPNRPTSTERNAPPSPWRLLFAARSPCWPPSILPRCKASSPLLCK